MLIWQQGNFVDLSIFFCSHFSFYLRAFSIWSPWWIVTWRHINNVRWMQSKIFEMSSGQLESLTDQLQVLTITARDIILLRIHLNAFRVKWNARLMLWRRLGREWELSALQIRLVIWTICSAFAGIACYRSKKLSMRKFRIERIKEENEPNRESICFRSWWRFVGITAQLLINTDNGKVVKYRENLLKHCIDYDASLEGASLQTVASQKKQGSEKSKKKRKKKWMGLGTSFCRKSLIVEHSGLYTQLSGAVH